MDGTTGRPTAAAIHFCERSGHPIVPPGALDLASMGYLYAPGKLVHYAGWTSTYLRSRDCFFGSAFLRSTPPHPLTCFFVNGGFQIPLTPGTYHLLATKGYEYTPVEKTIEIRAHETRNEVLRLLRWVDMAANGWYSGDAHVHIERKTPLINLSALLWAAAEDIRVANVLVMGDAAKTYYAQYAFGEKGRLFDGERLLVPGQEDPRTAYLGHALHLNSASMVRDSKRYYDYRYVFEQMRRAGALSGFAHVGRRRWHFQAERGLTLLAPLGLVDFVEIAEMGYIGVQLWYEFLNLGFRLTAVAGSDVPWGGTIGAPRMYAWIDPHSRFDAYSWFESVRQGRTFVTTGPMLEFRVNGQPPGSVLRLRRGDRVRVEAKAWGGPAGTVPLSLEVVAWGKTLEKTSGSALTLELVVRQSLWLTARCQTNREPLMDQPGFFTGAIATPVYLQVEGQPWYNASLLPDLIRRRLRCLDEIELAMRHVPEGGPAAQESAKALYRSLPRLAAQVHEARAFYWHLLEHGKEE